MEKGPIINVDALVINVHKEKGKTIIYFLTAQRGIIRATIGAERLQRLSSAAYIKAFSAVHATFGESQGFYNLQQIDGVYTNQSLDQSLESVAYGAVASEAILSLFPHGEAMSALFLKIHHFSLAIKTKPLRLSTIILCWQLLDLAGFLLSPGTAHTEENFAPVLQEIRRMTNLPVKASLGPLISRCLRVAWDGKDKLSFSAQEWRELEALAFAYCEAQSGKEFKSLQFLRAVLSE